MTTRDSETFDAFYAGSVRRPISQLHAMTGDRAEAENVVQEACARAWHRRDGAPTAAGPGSAASPPRNPRKPFAAPGQLSETSRSASDGW
jgi:hypothetical protein